MQKFSLHISKPVKKSLQKISVANVTEDYEEYLLCGTSGCEKCDRWEPWGPDPLVKDQIMDLGIKTGARQV